MLKYLRLVSLLSLLAIVAIAVTTGMTLRSLALDYATRIVELGNVGIADGYINAVWKKYRDVIIPLSADPAKLKDNPQVMEFAQETVRYFQDLPIVRANVYNASGALLLTINISNSSKIAGGNVSPDPAFAASHLKNPTPSSNLLSSVIMQGGDEIAIIQTMVPMKNGNGPADGSIEVLRNIQGLWDDLTEFRLYCIGVVMLVFSVLVSTIYVSSKRAESIIARQQEANVELAAAAATAQAESQEKSQFLANVSHELRTPLNAIIGFSDIIKTEIMPKIEEKKYHDYINDIHSSGVHLLSLINDILDYSKAEAGKLELEISEVNATKVVQNAMRLVGARADSGGITLSENLPKDQFNLMTDSKKFKQILLNLLSNAVKFTPNGGRITVSAWHNALEDTYSFEVKDTGIGIAPKDISRAMAPFGQVDNTLKRKYEGTGLGLPLTKKFVELMGGKFTIESEVNVGTKITFTLPRQITPREGLIIKQAS